MEVTQQSVMNFSNQGGGSEHLTLRLGSEAYAMRRFIVGLSVLPSAC